MIPAEIRSRLDFEEGDELRVRVDEGRLVLESPSAALAAVRKKLSEGAGSRNLTDELIERRRAESGLGQAGRRADAGAGRTGSGSGQVSWQSESGSGQSNYER